MDISTCREAVLARFKIKHKKKNSIRDKLNFDLIHMQRVRKWSMMHQQTTAHSAMYAMIAHKLNSHSHKAFGWFNYWNIRKLKIAVLADIRGYSNCNWPNWFVVKMLRHWKISNRGVESRAQSFFFSCTKKDEKYNKWLLCTN